MQINKIFNNQIIMNNNQIIMNINQKVKYFLEKNMQKINFGKIDIKNIKDNLIGMLNGQN